MYGNNVDRNTDLYQMQYRKLKRMPILVGVLGLVFLSVLYNTRLSLISKLTASIGADSETVADTDAGFEKIVFTDETELLMPGHIVETVEVMYNNLQYRKVCASVGTNSVLCMTIRYPFEVPLQTNDTTIRYPSPFQEKFRSLNKTSVYVVHLKDWLICKQSRNGVNSMEQKTITNDNDEVLIDVIDKNIIKKCLLSVADEQKTLNPQQGDYVVALWTRQSTTTNRTMFHGIGHDAALRRMYHHFGSDMILFTGASPTPQIMENSRKLFGGDTLCIDTVKRNLTKFNFPNFNCNHIPPKEQDQSTVNKTTEFTPPFSNEYVNVTRLDYRMGSEKDGNYDNYFLKHLLDNVKRPPSSANSDSLQKMSLIIDYPIAHVYREDENPVVVRRWHQIISHSYTEVISLRGKLQLKQQNLLDLKHLIVFDGLPQFFPTETNGFSYQAEQIKNEMGNNPDSFTYEGWKPEYGRSCVGPLPSNSILREQMLQARSLFFHLVGYKEMSPWYGRTGLFVNLFFFQMVGYDRIAGLDCTHDGSSDNGVFTDGFSAVHAYFLQAMVDDYLESEHNDM